MDKLIAIWSWWSFLLGALCGLVVSYFTSIASEAGKDSWRWAKNKFSPAPPQQLEPKRVVFSKFQPLDVPSEMATRWISESKLERALRDGWVYYFEGGRMIYCEQGSGPHGEKHWMMMQRKDKLPPVEVAGVTVQVSPRRVRSSRFWSVRDW